MPIIQSVERALKILDLFDERQRELSITEISKQMDLHKSTIHSLLKTLQAYGYIVQSEESGRYMLGLKLFERGSLVVSNLDVRSIARKHLEKLSDSTNLTVHLVILSGQEGVYIDKVEGSGVTVFYSKIGRRVPIHTSAVGKAIVSDKSNAEIEKILTGYQFIKQTEKSVGTKEEFLKEIEKVRIQGYAIDNEENEPGIVCVSVPVKDYSRKAIAGVSMSMPAVKADDITLQHYVKLLQECTFDISKDLGFNYAEM